MTVAERRILATLYGVAASVVVLDQASKIAAVAALEPGRSVRALDGFLHWTLERNPGAAFSLFTRVPALFTVLAFAISIAIIVGARKVRGSLNAVAFGLVLGGAAGNLVDRIARAPGPFRGHVVDFIDFRVWPVFNIADSCVVIGAGLLVVASIVDERKKKVGGE